MKLIVHVVSGPARGRKIPVQLGERARFGASDAADVCLPSAEMADIHFEIWYQDSSASITSYDPSAPTLVNDKPITQSVLSNGDQILAGQNRMSVSIESARPSVIPVEQEPEEAVEVETLPTLAEVVAGLELDEQAPALIAPDESAKSYASRLVESGLFFDAIKVFAHCLPKRQAVQWAHQAISSQPSETRTPEDQQALVATQQWLDDPSEDNRRAAMGLAEKLNYDTPSAYVAASAAWSEGSMVPAQLDPVAPHPQLCAKMAAGAIQIHLSRCAPDQMESQARSLLAIGFNIADSAASVA
ncbi:FHA domain-containing protein [Rhodopirellula sp. MGV]|uniref:FHA domain-containing protein n=1 Tax=Rhodopirellula sp. MGV TaxID=2023130 RepID=UPI000B961F93|nr:FHA domain-containing protein [Rhodopirellula sp. MGV]OYP35814.1 hypothetical protein CGZ80_10465 [Rhodopirellula sp. MGV]PNY36373.1 FHA domain-containing protein [Rhodopirellula baltica]